MNTDDLMSTPPWFELQLPLQIECIGYFQNLCDRHPTRKNTNYWILVLLDKGKRTLLANGKQLKISAREFFLLPPHTKQLPFETDEHTACFVHFLTGGKEIPTPNTIDATKLCLPMCGRLPDDIDCFMHLRYLYEHSISPYASTDFIALQLQAILSVISLHCQKHPQQITRESLFASLCLNFIQEHACQPLCAQRYEKELGLSYHQINQKFKKLFGFTIKQYHHKLRMKHAMQLLQSGLPLRQIAEECGYEDYYFFTKTFKKEYGVSPSLFRAMQ